MLEQLLAGTAAHGEEPTQEQVFSQELQPMGNPHQSTLFLKEWTPWKRAVVELQPEEKAHIGALHEVLYLSGLWDRGTA